MTELNKEAPTKGPFGNAIRNPGNPNHMMVVKPVEQRVRVYVGDDLIADTKNAVRVIEIGRDVYDPMVYVPNGDILVDLDRGTKETHCPLKGDASYRDFKGTEIGWTYDVYEFASKLDARTGFWPAKVRLIEGE